ncbi:MAG: ABC transporter ATP-binding protein [Chloroflexi bacterium]|nr:ABC transporter ATP-binding protein [Chloroflexota bacterium]
MSRPRAAYRSTSSGDCHRIGTGGIGLHHDPPGVSPPGGSLPCSRPCHRARWATSPSSICAAITGGTVAIQGRRLHFRGSLALDGVSLSVAAGSITALVGPNAAGKSTLIKTFVGFERPTSGSVRVLGIYRHRDGGGALARLGYVPQAPSLYRELSAADHMDMALHVRPDFDRQGALDHLEDLGIDPRAHPGSLSGGQQAQVMLAIALGARPEVLLLDEPLASLDPLARTEFLALLRQEVRERGTTALLSSHIVTDIEQVCDRLIVLGVGRVLLDETLDDAKRMHGVLVGDEVAPDGVTEVGRFPGDDGAKVALVRLGPALAHDSLRPATIDEVVKGYLVAGRRGRVGQRHERPS